ncbi:MAG: sulfite exporter TauE/SafE family protein [Acetobacteraceae bacterium]|nr:sulfite exporter TauE/SafE family protein [Acetobacteraceae bacterium]
MSAVALIVVVGIFAAGLLRGFTGFGLAMAAAPVLSLAMPPQQFVPVIVTLQLLTGAVDLPLLWRQADWRPILWLVVAMVVCTPLGLLALAYMSADAARLAIGLLIFAAIALLGRGLVLPEHPARWITLLVGAISGVMNGVAAMAGPPAVVYFLALRCPTEVMRASTISYFFLTAAAAMVPMAWRGLASWETTLWALIALPALLLGQWLGTLGFRRTNPDTHRRVALVTLTVLASLLTGQALLALANGP